MSNFKISDRMRTIESMVIFGCPLADVGTDHGFIPLDLLAENKIPYAILTDVNEGPLKLAAAHAKESCIDEDLYALRLGDGLKPLKNGEADTVIIAGMGGELIEKILDADTAKTRSFKRFILQPRTHSDELRYYLSTNAFEIVDYALVKEKGRICEVYAAEPQNFTLESSKDSGVDFGNGIGKDFSKDSGSDFGKDSDSDFGNGRDNNSCQLKPDTDIISKFLLSKNDPLIKEFVDYKISVAQAVLANLENSDSEESKDITARWQLVLNELCAIRCKL